MNSVMVYLITQEHPDYGTITIVYHPLLHGPLEDYKNNSKFKVTEYIKGIDPYDKIEDAE